MIKDLVVQPVRRRAAGRRRSVCDFDGRSLRGACVGVAFSYEPVIPPTIMGSIPGFADRAAARRERQGRGRRAREIRAAARRAGVAFDSRILTASLPGAADRFGGSRAASIFRWSARPSPASSPVAQELVVEARCSRPAGRSSSCPTSRRPASSSTASWCAGTASRTAARAIADAHAAPRARQGDRRGDGRERAAEERRDPGRRHRPAPRPPWPQGRGEAHRRDRQRRGRARSCRTQRIAPPTSS